MSVADGTRAEVDLDVLTAWGVSEPPIPDPGVIRRRRTVMTLVVLTGMVTAVVLLIVVGSALGAGVPGGCGGG